MSTELWTDESFDRPTTNEYPNLIAAAHAKVAKARKAEAEAASEYRAAVVTAYGRSRLPRSDKGRTKMLNCDRCGETLHKTRIVVTTTGLNGKKAGERKRYCSQKCFDKSYRKGLSRLLPI